MKVLKRAAVVTASVLVFALAATATPLSLTPMPAETSRVVEPWGWETVGTPTFGSGWKVVGGDIDFVFSWWWTFLKSDEIVVDLSGNTLGSIQNTITGLTVGQEYTLAFTYTYNPDDTVTQTRLASVSISNAGGFSYMLGPVMNTTNGLYATLNDGPQWMSFSKTFTPTATSVTLTFTTLNNVWQGIVLRNDISVDSPSVVIPTDTVPEPATMGIVVTALLLIGAWRFRRT
jgi:hypothetical protein